MYLPLEGFKILDLARMIPGDLATRRLADLGADVVKVEEPGAGDYIRLIPPILNGAPLMHWALNRNKQSIAIDWRTPEGLTLVRELAEVADAIVEVSIPGRYQAAGLDFAAMRRKRPELVICSITGFGQTGPYAPLPSHGMSMDAQAGAVVVGEKDGRPVLDYSLGSSLGSELGAANAALAIVAALLSARTTGKGAWIDASCWDAAVEMQRFALTRAALGEPERREDPHDWVTYAPYRCRDGHLIMFCAQEQKFWRRFCEGVQRPDLITRWDGKGAAVDNRPGDETLRAELTAIFASEDAQTWLERFIAWQIPGSRIMTPATLLESDAIRARGLVENTAPLPNVLDPIRWVDSDARPGAGAAPAPQVDQHRAEVMSRWLGRTLKPLETGS
ncbi:MAG: CoA transferase [Hyphomonadaceae bacterium]|nr:CoA transferase [Hyphomonadaceae bacterium]